MKAVADNKSESESESERVRSIIGRANDLNQFQVSVSV